MVGFTAMIILQTKILGRVITREIDRKGSFAAQHDGVG
jgi:hypothetical protein